METIGNVGTLLRNPGPITPNILGSILGTPNEAGYLNQVPIFDPLERSPSPVAFSPRIPFMMQRVLQFAEARAGRGNIGA